MDDTLPPGWTGNDSDHHTKVGPITLTIRRERRYNPLTQKHHRVGPYLWSVGTGWAITAHSGTAGEPTAKEARAAAILAARVIAAEITQACDWLFTHPVGVSDAD